MAKEDNPSEFQDLRMTYFSTCVGLHLFVSAMIVVEGITRTVIAAAMGHHGPPAGNWRGLDDQFPPIVLVLGAVSEVIFGLAGIVHSLHGLLSSFTNRGTLLCIFIEFWFGMITFIIWVLAFPAYNADRDNNAIPGYSNFEEDSVSVLGILGGFAYCSSLQGSQVYFANCIHAAIKGKLEKQFNPAFAKARLLFYSLLYLLGTVSQLAIGCFVFVRPTTPPDFVVVSGPFVLTYPEINIAVGSYTTVIALYSCCRAQFPGTRFGKIGRHVFSYLLFFSYILNIAVSTLTQVATAAPPTSLSFIVNPVFALLTTLHLMPFYLDYQVEYCLNKDEMSIL